MIIIKIFFVILKDIYKIGKLTKCDIFDIIKVVGFGLVINALYGIIKLHDFVDIYVLIVSIYGTLKAKHSKKEKKC